MKRYRLFNVAIILSVSSFFIMASCEDELIGEELQNTPTNNFEFFWKTFDEHYGLFDVKRLDWKKIHDDFRPRVHDAMSEKELYDVLTAMIVQLNDNHLNLYPTNGELPVFPGGVLSYRNGVLQILKVQDDYDIEVVKRYVSDYGQLTSNIGYGYLSDSVVYLNIKGTDALKDAQAAMEKVISSAAAVKGVVVDIRGFYGGFDPVSQLMAGYFASSSRLYMTTRKKNGPAPSDFTEPIRWYAEPGSPNPFTGSVVVLTSRFTQSAGETFTLALKEFDHVTLLGDTTAGSLSDNPNFEMPNGWLFSVSVGDYRASDGISFEGIGIPPDVYARTTRAELLEGKDSLLEKARDLARQD